MLEIVDGCSRDLKISGQFKSMALSIFSLQSLRITLPRWNQTLSLCSCRRMTTPSKSNEVYEELGLPRPPKRPITPYLQFTASVTDVPTGRYTTERAAVIAKIWRSLSNPEKEKYFRRYEEAKAKYYQELQEYKNKLGDEQLKLVKFLKQQRRTLEKLEQKSKKKISSNKEARKSFEKPKFPISGYLMFVEDNAHKFNRSDPDFFSRAGKAWKNLSEAKREEYKQKYHLAREAHQLRLIEWELKMVDIGRFDLVRKRTLTLLAKSKNTEATTKNTEATTKNMEAVNKNTEVETKNTEVETKKTGWDGEHRG
ncbi:High mobility group box domain [Trinorchestia longiramus]|nr:High mobility group box domain [Trinorchestia longiramus]